MSFELINGRIIGQAPKAVNLVFPSGADMAADVHNYKFWNSDPTDFWLPKAQETLDLLAGGTDLVLLSGRNGIGKTMQYGRILEWTLDTSFQNAEDIVGSNPNLPFLGLDEATKVVHEGRTDAILNVLADRQAVIMFPGATHNIRFENKQRFIDQVAQYKPKTTIHDLGDVSRTKVVTEKAVAFLKAIGATASLIACVEEVPVLLAPRLFNELTDMNASPQTLTESILKDSITQTLKGLSKNNYALNIATRLTHFNPPEHPLFVTNTLNTAESIELYRWVGIELPKPDSFDIDAIGYDPYCKD